MKLEQNENGVSFDIKDIHPNDLHLIHETLVFASEILNKTPLSYNFDVSEKDSILDRLVEIENQLHAINNSAESTIQTIFNKVKDKVIQC